MNMEFISNRDTIRTCDEYVLDLGADAFIVYDRISPILLSWFNKNTQHIDMIYATPPAIRACVANKVVANKGSIVMKNTRIVLLDTEGSGSQSEQRLGLQFWQNFNLWIDCRRKILYLIASGSDLSSIKYHHSNYVRSQNNLGFLINKTGTVQCLFDGMEAQRAGLRIGDRIIEFNHLSFGSISEEIRDSLMNISSGNWIQLNINRDGCLKKIMFETSKNPTCP